MKAAHPSDGSPDALVLLGLTDYTEADICGDGELAIEFEAMAMALRTSGPWHQHCTNNAPTTLHQQDRRWSRGRPVYDTAVIGTPGCRGWANVGWNRAVPTKEVQTPVLDQLVATGIELQQFCKRRRHP